MKFEEWIEEYHDELWEEWKGEREGSFSVFRLKRWEERNSEE